MGAARDMTESLQDILSCITGQVVAPTPPPPTPPLPPPPPPPDCESPPPPPPPQVTVFPSPPSPPPPAPPSPPAPLAPPAPPSLAASPAPTAPDRPGPPSELISDLQARIDVQYKKYPRRERTPPRPALPALPVPPPPERSNSLGNFLLKYCPRSLSNNVMFRPSQGLPSHHANSDEEDRHQSAQDSQPSGGPGDDQD